MQSYLPWHTRMLWTRQLRITEFTSNILNKSIMTNIEVPAPRKVCFVTIGATATFDSLVRATLNPTFLEVLDEYRYTDLCIQHGGSGQTLLQEFREQDAKSKGLYGINISGFDFNKKGLGAEMMAAKGQDEMDKGVVISHAGTPVQIDYLVSIILLSTQVLARYSPPFE